MLYAYYRFDDFSAFAAAMAQLTETQRDDVSNLGELLDGQGDLLEGYHATAAWRDDVEPAAFEDAWQPATEAPVWFADVPRVPPVPAVPDQVTNFQARAVMRRRILGNGVSMETAIREMLWSAKQAATVLPESDEQRIAADEAWLAWEQSNHFTRQGALVNAIAASALGLSSGDLDDLFRQASEIEA